MKDRSILIVVAVLVLGFVAAITGFERVPNEDNPWLQHVEINIDGRNADAARERTVEAGGAQTAEVTIEQAVGELDVVAGDDTLMEARFDTNRSDWLPEVDYEVDGTVGKLTVAQPEANGFSPGTNRNRWDIELTRGLPLDLVIERGVGEGDVDLSGIDIRTLEAKLGVGDTFIDLTGPRTHDVTVDIEGGVGATRVRLPSGVGVRIRSEKGIGEIRLPDGLRSSGGYWTNDAYDGDGPKIEVRISQGIGEIRLEME